MIQADAQAALAAGRGGRKSGRANQRKLHCSPEECEDYDAAIALSVKRALRRRRAGASTRRRWRSGVSGTRSIVR